MALSAVDVIGPAFERTKQQLFRPFRLGQWIRLAVTGLLAGEMGSTGGCNLRPPFNSTTPRTPPAIPTNIFAGHVVLLVVGIFLLVVLSIALGFVFLYISSRMRFVLFDSIVAGECRIRQFWTRRGEPALRYFVWQILYLLAAIVGFAALFAIPFAVIFSMGWLSSPRDHILPLILIGTVAVLVFLAAAVALAVVAVFTKDFVVPQMALENITVGEGWRRLWSMMQQNPGQYAGYIGMKFVLAFGAAVIFGIVIFIVVLIMLIPVGGVGAIVYLYARSAALGWDPITIAMAAVAGMIILAAIFFVSAMISVPFMVFFPAYSMIFFSVRYPALQAALNPSPAS